MSVYYRLQKDNRLTSSTKGKYFAHAVMIGVVGTKELADIMQENCTVKRSDIVAVLNELVPTMERALKDSKRVKLDGFGSFKLGLRGTGSALVDDFTVPKNIKGVRVNFTPESETDSATGVRTKRFVSNTEITELPKNQVVGEKDAAKAKAAGTVAQ